MRYQFTITQPRRRFDEKVAAAALAVCLIAAAIAGGCGDDTPRVANAENRLEPPAGDAYSPVSGSTASVTAAPVTIERAESAYTEQRYDEAVTLLSTYVGEQPENPWGHYLLGVSAWRAGNLTVAQASLFRTLELDSTHVKARRNLVRVLLEAGRPDQALEHARIALEQDTTSESVRLLGRTYAGLGQVDDAVATFREAIVLNDRDVWAMNNLGTLHFEQGRFDDALGPLARAVELAPEVGTFQNNLGLALERTGHFRAAETAYLSAITADSTYENPRLSLARVEGLEEDPVLGPIDLGTVRRQFVERIEGWRKAAEARVIVEP